MGAHVAVNRGLSRCVEHAVEIGAEVIQVFLANPRGWAPPPPDPEGDERFRDACAERGLPVFVHAPYLINFGSPSPDTQRRSVEALTFALRRAAGVGALGVVVHAGSAVLGNRLDDALGQIRHCVRPLLADDGPRVLIEPTAGGGDALAADAASIGRFLEALDDERVGLCIDTCHLHAAGHDLSHTTAMRRAFREIESNAGPGRIKLIHANDSRDPAGSRRDRHAAIGAGTIGLDAFRALFSLPALRDVPVVVETEPANQAADVAALKTLRAATRRRDSARSSGSPNSGS